MATRNTKTQTAAAAEQTLGAQPEEQGFYATVREYAKNMGVELPSGRMLLAGTVVQIVTSVIGGISAVQFSGYIALGVLMLTGSAFISMLCAILIAVAGIVAALVAGSRAGAYVASGGVERDVKRVGNFVRGFFKKADTAPEAA